MDHGLSKSDLLMGFLLMMFTYLLFFMRPFTFDISDASVSVVFPSISQMMQGLKI